MATSTLSTLITKPFTFNNSPSKPSLPLSSFKIHNPLSSFKTHNRATLTTFQSKNHAASPSDFSSVAAPKTLKSRLHNGETLYGLFLLSFSPTFAEIAGLCGYDFVIVDMEHGPGGISNALSCIHALAATGTPAIIRLPENCPTWAKKAVDVGPQGIMFPMIQTPKAARQAVSYCRFPPNGLRGSAHMLVRASSYGIDEGYLGRYEDELLIICQVESVQGVQNMEKIATVDGVDCIHMGPRDLSASMGYLRDMGNKKVKEMMNIAEKAVLDGIGPKSGGAFLSGISQPFDGPDDLRRRGYHVVVGAVDVALFRSAAADDVKRFKLSLVDSSDDEK
jgi:2-keto-3-deoxy-L-rhamnonate aldolase RhmA